MVSFSSLRTGGARESGKTGSTSELFIPAYRGSTILNAPQMGTVSFHPCVQGEHSKLFHHKNKQL